VFDDQIADAELSGEPGDLLIGDFAGHLLAEFVGAGKDVPLKVKCRRP
jgi:hypothetical protein